MLGRLVPLRERFVVIGSSAMAIQGWEVAPHDLDLMAEEESVGAIVERLQAPEAEIEWAQDGEARRLECVTPLGPVDLYTSVSGRLRYADVLREAIEVTVGQEGSSVKVGSLSHLRDMRAAVGRSAMPDEAIPAVSSEDRPRVIAIDGPAGAGKSTVTRAVARRLGFDYLDTGAMYRSVTLAVLGRRADTDDHEAIARIAQDAEIAFHGERVLLDGRDVTGEIRSPAVTEATPHIAAYPEVRAAMLVRQRQLFETGGFVAEGRDTGTVVAPDAPLKIYLTASLDERARRRSLEIGSTATDVLEGLKERDRLDTGRAHSALAIAEDAVVLDTSDRSVDEVVDEIARLADERQIV